MLIDQPAYLIKMVAKPGTADTLFELASSGMVTSGASDHWIIAREEDDPNVMWAIEVFKSNEIKDAYENGPVATELREPILACLAEIPMRIAVRPYSAS